MLPVITPEINVTATTKKLYKPNSEKLKLKCPKIVTANSSPGLSANMKRPPTKIQPPDVLMLSCYKGFFQIYWGAK